MSVKAEDWEVYFDYYYVYFNWERGWRRNWIAILITLGEESTRWSKIYRSHKSTSYFPHHLDEYLKLRFFINFLFFSISCAGHKLACPRLQDGSEELREDRMGAGGRHLTFWPEKRVFKKWED